MPVPVSRTVNSAASAGLPQRYLDLSLKGELEGVGDQVENDLLPHLAIHVDRFAERRAIDHQLHPRPLDRRPENAGEFCREQGRSVGS